MIMRDYIPERSVVVPKAAGDRAKADEAELFIQLQRRCIRAYYGIELKYAEAKLPSLFHTVAVSYTHLTLPTKA